MGAIYFLAGALAMLLGLLVWNPKGEKRQRAGGVPWTSIDRLGWNSSFQMHQEVEASGQAIALGIAEAMRANIEKKPVERFTVKPGRYDVSLSVVAIFTKREE